MQQGTMADFRHSALTYLRFVLQETGLSPSALARKAGLSSTTITRPLNDKEHKFTLAMTTLEKIANVTGINPAPFIDAPNEPMRMQAWNDARTYDPELWPGVPIDPVDLVMVVGEVAAGNWRELDGSDMPDFAPLRVKSAFHKSTECFGLIVRGQSLNRIAKDGDILFCVALSAHSRMPVDGELVVVERRSSDGGKIEVTAKRLRGAPGSWQLWPESDHPNFQKPIETDTLTDDGEIRVIAEVEYIIRQP